MTSVRLTCLLALLAAIFAQLTSGYRQSTTPPPRCRPGLIIDCNFQNEDLVWSRDENNECKTILNSCLFDQANCARHRQGRPLLEKVSKQECQQLCVNDCSQAPKDTVCTRRGDKYCTFPSQCEWAKHLCNTGEFWFQENPLPCGSNPVQCFS
ncbi:uncharacterized protein LOC105665412 [Ceratitis capitata]|uniref:(Mediterranean fruit fly) hypothetical protein n=1 Tax=Ceratitis capitata TaxID=7213 RepID=A0A811UAB3_CERCA|nr:uncharacterized protein LOC105665412 [Ceratitis capitata]CAD6994263.1 unnamed protein product [Ceratitis capitata]